MKLSEKLKQDHESGDFGSALKGYSEHVEKLEREIRRLESENAELKAARKLLPIQFRA